MSVKGSPDWFQILFSFPEKFLTNELVEIDDLTMEEMTEKNVISVGTVLRLGSSSYVETQILDSIEDNIFSKKFLSAKSDSNLGVVGASILHVSPEDDFEIEEMDETTDARHYKNRRERRNRRLAKSTGDVETLVIRVVGIDGVEPPNAQQLEDDIFLDGMSLKTQFPNCSHDNINIQQTDKQGFDATYNGVEYKGIIDVGIETKAWVTHSYVMYSNAINNVENDLLNGESFENHFDLVMVCEPPGASKNGADGRYRNWLAYAYVHGHISAYNDYWCKPVSAQMHEVGRNLGLLYPITCGNVGKGKCKFLAKQ